MTRNDEDYLFDSLDQIRQETHENNVMLHQICDYINRVLAHANQENENDFGRNVIANLISSGFDINRFIRR